MNSTKEILQKIFEVEAKRKQSNKLRIDVEKKIVPAVLLYLKNQLGFVHLNHISCVDWIEQQKFELVYIVWNPQTKETVLVHTKIDRINPEMENIDTIWDQANTYEREMREMFGIEFPGLIGEKEFILEDWEELPPMRRDFDTNNYAKKTYQKRPGRENAQIVREAMIRKTGEELPGFAKKYSRDN